VNQCCGSGSGDLWIWDPGWKKIQICDPRSGINVSDHISEGLVRILWVKSS
jgi:hypothetical protein